jgi:hypothetical protein
MHFPLGTLLIAPDGLILAAVNIEAIGMYGLVALVIGLIAWSKYSEAPPSSPDAWRTVTPPGPALAQPAATVPEASTLPEASTAPERLAP